MLATEERDVRLNIRVDADLHRRLRFLAVERGTTSREIVARLLEEHLRGAGGTGEKTVTK